MKNLLLNFQLASLFPLLCCGCASLQMKGTRIDTKEKAIQACIDQSNQDTRYALPPQATIEVYGPWKSTWSFGWTNDGFNVIGDRLWQVVYTNQTDHTWLTVIWINAENKNLRIMKPEYSDWGLKIQRPISVLKNET